MSTLATARFHYNPVMDEKRQYLQKMHSRLGLSMDERESYDDYYLFVGDFFYFGNRICKVKVVVDVGVDVRKMYYECKRKPNLINAFLNWGRILDPSCTLFFDTVVACEFWTLPRGDLNFLMTILTELKKEMGEAEKLNEDKFLDNLKMNRYTKRSRSATANSEGNNKVIAEAEISSPSDSPSLMEMMASIFSGRLSDDEVTSHVSSITTNPAILRTLKDVVIEGADEGCVNPELTQFLLEETPSEVSAYLSNDGPDNLVGRFALNETGQKLIRPFRTQIVQRDMSAKIGLRPMHPMDHRCVRIIIVPVDVDENKKILFGEIIIVPIVYPNHLQENIRPLVNIGFQPQQSSLCRLPYSVYPLMSQRTNSQHSGHSFNTLDMWCISPGIVTTVLSNDIPEPISQLLKFLISKLIGFQEQVPLFGNNFNFPTFPIDIYKIVSNFMTPLDRQNCAVVNRRTHKEWYENFVIHNRIDRHSSSNYIRRVCKRGLKSILINGKQWRIANNCDLYTFLSKEKYQYLGYVVDRYQPFSPTIHPQQNGYKFPLLSGRYYCDSYGTMRLPHCRYTIDLKRVTEMMAPHESDRPGGPISLLDLMNYYTRGEDRVGVLSYLLDNQYQTKGIVNLIVGGDHAGVKYHCPYCERQRESGIAETD